MKFYEDQHKLAAYLERTGAEWEYQRTDGSWLVGMGKPSIYFIKPGFIRPVLRYNLPSHLQSEIANPDNLTEEQICEGGKYRACVKGEFLREGAEFYDSFAKRWSVHVTAKKANDSAITYRLPVTVPWPDWEADKATQPDLKDARIAELEMQLLALSNSCETLRETCSKITSPWRPMSEVPTEEGILLMAEKGGGYKFLHTRNFELFRLRYEAWFFVPDYHAKPDPLADLLKAHGVAVTEDLTAALNAWKGVEK